MNTMKQYESILRDWGVKLIHSRNNRYNALGYNYCLLYLTDKVVIEGFGRTLEEACKDIYNQVREHIWIQSKRLYEDHDNL